MAMEASMNALTSAIDCVQKDILAGNRSRITINSDKVRPYDELDHNFALYSALRQD